MNNIVIIQRDIDPSPYLKKIYNRWNDWDWVAQQQNIGGDKDPYGFLPLVWAKVKEGESPKDTNFLEQTPLFKHYPEVINFWKNNKIRALGRAAFFS